MSDPPPTDETSDVDASQQRTSGVPKPLILIIFLSAVVLGVWAFGDELTLKNLAARETTFRQFQADYPVLVYLAAFTVYVTVTGLEEGATAAGGRSC